MKNKKFFAAIILLSSSISLNSMIKKPVNKLSKGKLPTELLEKLAKKYLSTKEGSKFISLAEKWKCGTRIQQMAISGLSKKEDFEIIRGLSKQI
ncbi:hypothetical protein GF385_00450 [Candidatus Dependentiae bacterium]|nr:hypothetical protein [Candidatus Dependentiae bacterium]